MEIAAIATDDVPAGAVARWHGNGVGVNNWGDVSGGGLDGSVQGTPEGCLVHRRGAVVRESGGRVISSRDYLIRCCLQETIGGTKNKKITGIYDVFVV